MATRNRVRIGELGIDAGLLYLGDPCYLASTPLGRIADDSQDSAWNEFLLSILWDAGERWGTLRGLYAGGHSFPAGLIVRPGHGDGCYPVYAEFAADGGVARVTIDFSGR